MARPQTKARLIGFLSANTDRVVTISELCNEFPDLTISQIRVGINNIRNAKPEGTGGLDPRKSLQVVARGNAWKWNPVQAQANATLPGVPTCFETMGKTQRGDLILRADDGTLWKAEAL